MKRSLWLLGITAGLAASLILGQFVNRGRMGPIGDLAFDPTRGRLYATAGNRGLYSFSVDDGRLMRLSRFSDGGGYNQVEIQHERAYIADSERGLVVLDIIADRPRHVFSGDLHQGQGLHLAGGLLYLAAGSQGMIVFSLGDPDRPTEIGRYASMQDARDVVVEGTLAYLIDGSQGLEILDLASPAYPDRIGRITWDPVDCQAHVVQSEAGFVYIAAGEHGLQIIDARLPTTPVIAAVYHAGATSRVEGLAVVNGSVYLAVWDDQDGTQNGLHILDVHNPYAPQLLSISTYTEQSAGVLVREQTAFVANPWIGVRSYDTTDPREPHLQDRFRLFP